MTKVIDKPTKLDMAGTEQVKTLVKYFHDGSQSAKGSFNATYREGILYRARISAGRKNQGTRS